MTDCTRGWMRALGSRRQANATRSPA